MSTKTKALYEICERSSVRLSYTKNSAGVLEILEENNYYPFGLKHSGYNNIRGANQSYQYKYNGKELQESGMYDYGARFYMPDIGRWGVVDPLAEKSTRFSPYTYAFNNPIRFIDPDGRENEDWVKKDNKWTYDANITNAQQAQDAGYDDFKTNGSIISDASINGGEAGYVRLNEGGTADYLPNATAQDMLTNNLSLLSSSINNTINNAKSWFSNISFTSESDTFYINAGGVNTDVGYSTFRPGKDKVVDLEGYFGGMLNSLGISQFDIKMPTGDKATGLLQQVGGLTDIFKSNNDIDTTYYNYTMSIWNYDASKLKDTTIIWQNPEKNGFSNSNVGKAQKINSISNSRLDKWINKNQGK